MAQLRKEASEQLNVGLLVISRSSFLPEPTLFSRRISGLYSVQHTRLRSEQTLKSAAASG